MSDQPIDDQPSEETPVDNVDMTGVPIELLIKELGSRYDGFVFVGHRPAEKSGNQFSIHCTFKPNPITGLGLITAAQLQITNNLIGG